MVIRDERQLRKYVPGLSVPGPIDDQPVIVCDRMNFNPFDAFFLLPAMIVLQQLGHGLRLRRQTAPQSSAVEGAVFALFGLLLAFTFSGAVARFDAHRELVIEERNNIETAYLRLDLLPLQSQPPLRQLFRDYVDSRLHLYEGASGAVSPATEHLQREIGEQFRPPGLLRMMVRAGKLGKKTGEGFYVWKDGVAQ